MWWTTLQNSELIREIIVKLPKLWKNQLKLRRPSFLFTFPTHGKRIDTATGNRIQIQRNVSLSRCPRLSVISSYLELLLIWAKNVWWTVIYLIYIARFWFTRFTCFHILSVIVSCIGHKNDNIWCFTLAIILQSSTMPRAYRQFVAKIAIRRILVILDTKFPPNCKNTTSQASIDIYIYNTLKLRRDVLKIKHSNEIVSK